MLKLFDDRPNRIWSEIDALIALKNALLFPVCDILFYLVTEPLEQNVIDWTRAKLLAINPVQCEC